MQEEAKKVRRQIPMRVFLSVRDPWMLAGAMTLLEQSGISASIMMGFKAIGSRDFLITDDIRAAKRLGPTLIIGKQGEKKKKGARGSFLSFEEEKAYCPVPTPVSAPSEGWDATGFFDSEAPAIIEKEDKAMITPSFFEIIPRAGTVGFFDKEFSANFGWDCFRNIFIRVMEKLSERSGNVLARVWYYPSSEFENSLTYTTDVDHMTQWKIVSGMDYALRARSFLARTMPKSLLWALACAASNKHYSREYYSEKYVPRPLALCGRVMKCLRMSIPDSFFMASILGIRDAGIPITAFLRPSEYQKEESLARPPKGLMREPYSPSAISGVEAGLHFGASIGEIDHDDKIDNPYAENVFGEAIPKQRTALEKRIGTTVNGSRLHNGYRFTQEMFPYIEKSGVRYDSSVFEVVLKTSDSTEHCRLSPAGTSMPYTPFWNESGMPRLLGFTEIPVTAYEEKDIRFELLRKNNASIVISEHADHIRSEQTEAVLKELKLRRREFWLTDLQGLASWWKSRNKLKVWTGENLMFRNANNSAMRVCIVSYPERKINMPEGIEDLGEKKSEGRRYVDIGIRDGDKL